MTQKQSEKHIEHTLVQATKARGGIAWKFTSTITGVPDRLITLPGGKTGFIELKTTGQKPTPKQQHIHHKLRTLGHQVHVIDHTTQIQGTLDAIQTTPLPDGSHQNDH